MFMATKTLTITEDAYERLHAMKEEGESFSEVIRRITSKVKLADFAGILSDEETKMVKERIGKMRKLSSQRMKQVREQLQ